MLLFDYSYLFANSHHHITTTTIDHGNQIIHALQRYDDSFVPYAMPKLAQTWDTVMWSQETASSGNEISEDLEINGYWITQAFSAV